jgi:capsular exopolysaccharide synthesis family protein
LHKIFGLSNQVGLTNILNQTTTVAEAIQNSNIPGVQIIPSGPLTSDPAELLDSPQVLTLIEELKQQADLVLFDTPSLLAVSDAAVLAPMVDGVVLVIGRAQAYQEAVQAARHQLAAVGAILVGIVVNRANQVSDYFYRYASKVDAT